MWVELSKSLNLQGLAAFVLPVRGEAEGLVAGILAERPLSGAQRGGGAGLCSGRRRCVPLLKCSFAWKDTFRNV